MLNKHRLTDVYVNDKQEVVMVYSVGAREHKFVTIPMLEAIKLRKHLNEIL